MKSQKTIEKLFLNKTTIVNLGETGMRYVGGIVAGTNETRIGPGCIAISTTATECLTEVNCGSGGTLICDTLECFLTDH